MVTKQLAKFTDLTYDPTPYQGRYSSKRPSPRDIPTDRAIVDFWERMANPGWRFVYGAIATYGLRPHEAFKIDFDRLRTGDRVLQVLSGKTGPRRVWPFHPEWFDQFHLGDPVLPGVNLNRRNDQIGHSASRYFWELKCPFKLYDLRHAWAIRTLEYGLEDALAARQMGHSTEVHNDIYQHWLDEKVQQRAYDRLLAKSDRPLPP